MPKSKARKNHKKKVNSWKRTMECKSNKLRKEFENIKRLGEEAYNKQQQDLAEQEAEKVEGLDEIGDIDVDEDILEEIDIDVDEQNEKTSD
jgi:hypothetical protein